MLEFSELLNKIIKQNDLSIYGLAKMIECDRTWLQKVLIGERHMDYEIFNRLYAILKMETDEKSMEELYETFAKDYFGDKDYFIIQYIKRKLSEMEQRERYFNELRKKIFDLNIYIKESQLTKGEKDLIQRAYQILCEEFRQAKKSKRNPQIYIYIPIKWKYLYQFFLCLFNTFEHPENIDFKCYFSNTVNESEEIMRLEKYFACVEFAQYGFDTYSDFDNNKKISNVENGLFPNYIITKQSVLLIDEDGLEMIENLDSEFINNTLNKVNLYFESRNSFLIEVEPERFSSFVINELTEDESLKIEISNNICVATRYTREILEKIIPHDIPKREFSIVTLSYFYEKARKKLRAEYFTMESIFYFMNTDDTKLAGQYYNLIFTREIKLQLLELMYEAVMDLNFKFNMICTEKYRFHSRLHIFLLSKRNVMCNSYKYKNGKRVEAMGFVNSPTIARQIYNFDLYFRNSSLCLNKENSINILKNIIDSYK